MKVKQGIVGLFLILIMAVTVVADPCYERVRIERSGDMLEMNEYLGDVVETMDAADADALDSYMLVSGLTNTSVNQYIRFLWGPGFHDRSYARVVYHEDDDDLVGDRLLFEDGREAFRYEIEFEEGLTADFAGHTGTELNFATLNILAEEFAIVRSDISGGRVDLEMMSSAHTTTMMEGETMMIEIDGVDREVTVLIIGESIHTPGLTVAKIRVDGEISKELESWDSEVYAGGLHLFTTDVTEDPAGDTVTFSLGEGYVHFNDADPADPWDGYVEVNDEAIEDAEVNIDYTLVGTVLRIHSIQYTLSTDGRLGDEVYMQAGDAYSSWLDEPEGMLSERWDIEYDGFVGNYSDVSIYPDGDFRYRLSFTNTQGVEYDIPFVHVTDGEFRYGTSNPPSGSTTYPDGTVVLHEAPDDVLFFGMTDDIMDYDSYSKEDDYVVLTHRGTYDVTRIVQPKYLEPDWSMPTTGMAHFYDVGTGTWIVARYDGLTDRTPGTGHINVGGYSFDFWLTRTGSVGKERTRVLFDVDDDGLPGGEAQIVVNGGGLLDLGDQPAGYNNAIPGSMIDLTLTTAREMFSEMPADDEVVHVTVIGDPALGVDLTYSRDDSIGLRRNTPDAEPGIIRGMTNYGVLVEQSEVTDPSRLTMSYPLAQVFPEVFVVFEEECAAVPMCHLFVTPTSGTAPLLTAFDCTVAGGDAPYDFLVSSEFDASAMSHGTMVFNTSGVFDITCTVVDVDGDVCSDVVSV
ncbi:hypothetical protein KY362_04270, partial [Candidatus Woesearchaeota archaeon]|nr:hypothetical protein [Candidatus Woesearchaeota archaeon]